MILWSCCTQAELFPAIKGTGRLNTKYHLMWFLQILGIWIQKSTWGHHQLLLASKIRRNELIVFPFHNPVFELKLAKLFYVIMSWWNFHFVYIVRQSLLSLKTDFISYHFSPVSVLYFRCQSRGCYFRVFFFSLHACFKTICGYWVLGVLNG